jgi:hypothetical protein
MPARTASDEFRPYADRDAIFSLDQALTGCDRSGLQATGPIFHLSARKAGIDARRQNGCVHVCRVAGTGKEGRIELRAEVFAHPSHNSCGGRAAEVDEEKEESFRSRRLLRSRSA